MANFFKIALKIITVLPGIIDCIKYNIKKIKEAKDKAPDQEGGSL
jgi:hypothetical protein